MKKGIILSIIVSGMILSASTLALAEEDYSYLDDMTINELKKLDEEIHKRIPVPAAASESVTASEPTTIYTVISDAETEGEKDTVAFDEPVTVMDNEYTKVDFTGKYLDTEEEEIGYLVTVENKMDKYLEIFPLNASINNLALDNSAGPYASFYSIAPKGKAEGSFYFPLDGRELGMELSTLDDLENFNCVFQISWSDDGATFNSNDMVDVPLSCIVP